MSDKKELRRLDREIETVLERIMSASNDTIIRRYEEKVELLERQKLVLAEKLENQSEPEGSFEETLEHPLTPRKPLENPGK